MEFNNMAVAQPTQSNEQVVLDITKEPLPEMITENNTYKEKLKQMPEVQALTNEINIQDNNTILQFGSKPSENISKISDELLNTMRNVKSEDCSEMLKQLTKIMDKFDIKEIKDEKDENALQKIFNKTRNNVDKLFEKYDNMGKEVDKIYVILRQYEADIQKANDGLNTLYEANLKFFDELEKYIAAGELGLEEIDNYKKTILDNPDEDEQRKQMISQQLDLAREMLSQRIYDLQIAENVAIQSCPMMQMMEQTNFNLLRKINSSFVITLPIFKQCLIQAINLKRTEIQAKSIKQLDDKTNELLLRNAQNTASQSVQLTRMTSGSSIQMETLEKNYETIKNGINETKTLTEEIAKERAQNSTKLEQMKNNMKTNNFV